MAQKIPGVGGQRPRVAYGSTPFSIPRVMGAADRIAS